MISRITGFLAAIAMVATLAVSPAHAQDQKPADAASAAVAETAAAPAAPAASAAADNPYSLANIVAHGNVVDQVVLVILAIMSMGHQQAAVGSQGSPRLLLQEGQPG
jgi:biopolymer transport protein ExbB